MSGPKRIGPKPASPDGKVIPLVPAPAGPPEKDPAPARVVTPVLIAAPAHGEPSAPAPATPPAKDPTPGPVRISAPAPAAHPEAKTGIVAELLERAACPKCGHNLSMDGKAPLTDTICASCGTPFMVPGRLDAFVLLERIGAGEMGDIYRARDEALGRDVAIKTVIADRQEEARLHERLHQEARAAARLSHPNVAQIYALGFSNGHPYLVMELVRGEDMDVRLRREGRIDELVVLRIAEEVTDGLKALHREGLTHGDIKPANIVMDSEGSSKLIDFGLSGMSRRDGTKAILGTPQYIAPESLRGAPDSAQTDLYSLGATLYHLLSGKPPFDGPTPADIARLRLLQPADPIARHAPTLSQATQRIVMRMLEGDPSRRYRDCGEALKDIRKALKSLEPVAPAERQETVPDGQIPKESGVHLSLRQPKPPPAAEAPSQPRQASKAAPAQARRPQQRSSVPKAVLAVIIVLLLSLIAGLAGVYFKRNEILSSFQARRQASRIVTPLPAEATNSLAATPAQQTGAPASPTAQQPDALTPSPPPQAGVAPSGAIPQPIDLKSDFPRLLSPQWIMSKRGPGSGGFTFWNKGTLILRGEGADIKLGSDVCRSLYAAVAGDFAFHAKLTAAATQEQGMTGLLIWEAPGDIPPSLFFGRLGDGSLILQMRRNGEIEQTVRTSDAPVSVPVYLQIVRRGDLLAAFWSSDGSQWNPFAQCTLSLPSGVCVGMAVAAGYVGTLAASEYQEIVLRAPPAVRPKAKP